MIKRNSRAKTVYLTPEMRSQKAINEFHRFLDAATEAEKEVICHLKIGDGAEDLMRRIRTTLKESAERCKVIPFPQERVRKSTKSARKTGSKIEPVILELQKGI
ncbi:hypothetical protein SAMN05216302_104621 [Nitrosomonas aestuarii]|uniref:Uncharacterized protein n=1 Tax=Nitrosomonas aestuarii TaxID=52441 RepID=A0A1I4G2C7_9PROT|nr:hypothetical protein [Nitrosomonas aestuarii]SFL24174.1 hypothetical protein SAMN05216302_104621 [Nitrosomonas aestuarii]